MFPTLFLASSVFQATALGRKHEKPGAAVCAFSKLLSVRFHSNRGGEIILLKNMAPRNKEKEGIHLQESVSARLSQEKSLEVCGVLVNNLKFFSSLFV